MLRKPNGASPPNVTTHRADKISADKKYFVMTKDKVIK